MGNSGVSQSFQSKKSVDIISRCSYYNESSYIDAEGIENVTLAPNAMS